MYRNKRLEFVLILSLLILSFLCICSMNDKISEKKICKNLSTYIASNASTVSLEKKITYNNKLYILYSIKDETNGNLGYIEFKKNFLGWWCANKTESTTDSYSVSSISSVLNSNALLIYGKNSSDIPYELNIETPSKTLKRDIHQRTYYMYIEEINCESSKVKLSSK